LEHDGEAGPEIPERRGWGAAPREAWRYAIQTTHQRFAPPLSPAAAGVETTPDLFPEARIWQGSDKLALYLVFSSIWLNMLVAAPLLNYVGIAYSEEGGNPIFKLHPGTYLAVIGLAVYLWRFRNPIEEWKYLFRKQRAYASFLVLCFSCSIFTIIFHGPNMSSLFVENYFPAGIACLLMSELAERRQARLFAYVMLALMFLSNAIGGYEFVTQSHLIPLKVEGYQLAQLGADFRAYALYGHPLIAAETTMSGVFLILATPMNVVFKALSVLAFLLSLLNYGGRTALIVTLVTLGFLAVRAVAVAAIRGSLRIGRLVGGVAFTVAGTILVLSIAVQFGLGERIAKRLYWDESAQARSIEFEVPGLLPTSELLFGTTSDLLQGEIYQLGLVVPFEGVENCWLATFLWLGVIGFPLYVVAMYLFLRELWRRVGFYGRVMLATGMFVASTSMTLGAKDPLLTVLAPLTLSTVAFERKGTRDKLASVAAPTPEREGLARPSITLKAGRSDVVPGATS
jgi:hypothetical protein